MSINIEIKEDFLSEVDLKELQSLSLKKTYDKEINVYVKKIDGKNNISGNGMSDSTVRRLQERYHNKAIDLLNKLNPKKQNYMNIQNLA